MDSEQIMMAVGCLIAIALLIYIITRPGKEQLKGKDRTDCNKEIAKLRSFKNKEIDKIKSARTRERKDYASKIATAKEGVRKFYAGKIDGALVLKL